MVKQEFGQQQLSQIEKVKHYYLKAGDYAPGRLLDGRCHFGFSDNKNGLFDLETAQLAMEDLLGERLNLPKGSKVLDAGCGWGPVARRLTTDFGLEVQGIDLMRERLQGARKIDKEGGVNIDLSEADYHHLPFSDSSFDGVYTIETLVHADPLESVLKEFKRVLKPGGKLVLFEYSIPDLNSLIPVAKNMANRVIRRTAMAGLPRFIHGVFPSLLEAAGFENVTVTDVSRNVWPTWHFLWKNALKRTFNEILDGDFRISNIQGSTMIYPARHWLRYNVCEASNPKLQVN